MRRSRRIIGSSGVVRKSGHDTPDSELSSFWTSMEIVPSLVCFILGPNASAPRITGRIEDAHGRLCLWTDEMHGLTVRGCIPNVRSPFCIETQSGCWSRMRGFSRRFSSMFSISFLPLPQFSLDVYYWSLHINLFGQRQLSNSAKQH